MVTERIWVVRDRGSLHRVLLRGAAEVASRVRGRFEQVDGADATAEALAYAWENWERVKVMDNPAG